jgi:hypothetical protein
MASGASRGPTPLDCRQHHRCHTGVFYGRGPVSFPDDEALARSRRRVLPCKGRAISTPDEQDGLTAALDRSGVEPVQAVYGDRFPAPEEKKLMSEPAPSGLIGSVVLLTGE